METVRELSTIFALFVAIGTLLGFWSAQRKAAREEGVRIEQSDRMKKDIDRVFDKLRAMQDCFHARDLEMAGIKKDVTYIKTSVDEIKTAIKESRL